MLQSLMSMNLKLIPYLLFVIRPVFGMSQSDEKPQITSGHAAEVDQVMQVAKEAYLYGYPLVMMEITKRVMTNVKSPSFAGAPVNQIYRKEVFPDDKFTAVVKPNCDTYYALAWLDLSQEPLVLDVPDTHDRYYLLPILDAWTNVIASPGKRTTGTETQRYLITGPGWKGNIPGDMKQIASPTNMAWLAGRTQVNNSEDGATAVKEIQQGYRLTPLSSYGKHYIPPPAEVDPLLSMKAPSLQIIEMPVADFFNLLNLLLVNNAPLKGDSAILKRISKLGIAPGGTFNAAGFSPDVMDSLSKIPFWCKEHLAELAMKQPKVNGWTIPRGLGNYGTRYEQRALIASRGLGANLDDDAVYPSSATDADGEKYDGAKHAYVLHFDAGKFPPAHAFWSITMYNMNNFLVENSINRFAIGDRHPLKRNVDGSLDIYIQHQHPGKDKESNWLPAPAGPFNLTMRIYWPAEAVLNGSWMPPVVAKAD